MLQGNPAQANTYSASQFSWRFAAGAWKRGHLSLLTISPLKYNLLDRQERPNTLHLFQGSPLHKELLNQWINQKLQFLFLLQVPTPEQNIAAEEANFRIQMKSTFCRCPASNKL